VLLAAALSVFYVNVTHTYKTLPPVHLSAELASSARTKFDALGQASAEAQKQGKPVTVSESFNDDELSSYANEQLGSGGVFTNVVLHANANATIEGTGDAHYQGQTIPVYVVCVVIVVAGQPQLQVIDSKAGDVDTPQGLRDQINAQLQQSVKLGQPLTLTDLTVLVSENSVTISGTALPA
jgi:hypothetical protein